MDEDQKNIVEKKKWRKYLLISVFSVFAIYLALFAVRFIQLNFSGRQTWTADSIPQNLLKDVEHDFPDAWDDWETLSIPLQIVDLDGDFEQEFILYTRSMIQVYRLNSEKRWQYAAGADLVEKFVYLPFSIWGYPTVLRVDKLKNEEGLFTKLN